MTTLTVTDENTGELVTVDIDSPSGNLYVRDADTGEFLLLDLSSPVGTIKVIDAKTGEFVEIDYASPTGTVNVIDQNTGEFVEISLDSPAGILYCLDDNTGELVEIDTSTASFFSIGGFVKAGSSDTTAPTAVITCAQTSPTAVTPLQYTITFSEPVTGFTEDDFVLAISGGTVTKSAFTAVSESVYTCNGAPSIAGVVTANVAAGVAVDAAGNENEAATQISISYSGLIGDWLMNEASGTTAIDASGFGNHGTYNGVTLNQVVTDATGRTFTCPYWGGNGSHDYMHFYSEGLINQLNMDRFSVAGWLRVENAGVWTDGFFHDWVVINIDSVHQFFIRKQSVNNRVYGLRTANSEVHQIQIDGLNTTDWFHWCVAGSVESDTFNFYINGVKVAEFFPYSSNELWTGIIPSNTCILGASVAHSTVSTHEWQGWMARLKLYNYVLSEAEIAALAAESEM